MHARIRAYVFREESQKRVKYIKSDNMILL